MVDDLKELLLGPRRAVVRADVVQNENGDVLDLIEHLVVGEFRVICVAAPELVEQVRDKGEEDRVSLRHQTVGGSGTKTGLAGTVAAREEERPVRRLGEGPRCTQRSVVAGVGFGADAGAGRGQRLEGDVVEHAEVAVALQACKAVRFAALDLAEAREGAPEVRMSDRQVTAHPALTSAGRAGVSVSGLGVELLHPLRNGGDVREVPLL